MKIKTISKRVLTLLLTVLMLVSTMTIGIASPSAANVELAPTGVDHTGGYVYFLAPSTWTSTYVMMFIGHDSYTSVYQMTKVTNTDNLYRYTMPSWGGANYVAFANASSLWGSGNWGPNNRTNATHYTNVYKDYGFNSGSYYVCVPASDSNNAGISINYKTSASNLNLTTRANVYAAEAGSTTYGSNAAAGTVSVSGRYMSSYSAASTRSAVSSTASTAYASTTLAPGSTATFTAKANSGYKFVGWSTSSSASNIVSTSTTYTFKYDISYTGKTVYALFEKEAVKYTYTFKDWDGTQLSTGTLNQGETPTAPANPTREGYTFTGWSPAVGAITADTEYTALYTINRYNVTATASPAAGGTASASSATVPHGDSVTLTATPNVSAGYAFTGWEITGNYTITSGSLTAESVTLTATSAINATATFQQIPTYTVKGVVGLAGAGTVSPTQQEVAEGSAIILTANPNTGYVFTGWTIEGDYTVQSGTTSSQSFSIIPREDVTATANFRANSATVNFATSVGGSVSNSGSHTVTYPGSAASTATAGTGYTFSKWTVTGGTLNTDYTMTGSLTDETITITPIKDGANLTVTASFTINKYTVTFEDHDGTVLDTQTVEYGKGATAPADPVRTGYTFSGWDKTFSNITADTTVTATYTANIYNVTADVLGAGGTAYASVNKVTYPNTVTLTAEAENDYVFNGWTITGAYEVVSGDKNTATFVIIPEADITATASFVKGQYLTIHSYSSNGYENLYVWESNGTNKDVTDAWPGTPQPNETTFNGVTWDTSNQLELTYGYSTEVGAVLSGGTSSETVIYVDFSNAGSNWSGGPYLSVTASTNSDKRMDSSDTSGAGSYVPKNDTWLGAGELVSGSTYKWTIPSANVSSLKNYGFTVWSSNEHDYDQVWAVDVSHVAYSTTNNTYTISSSMITHGDRKADCFTLTASSNTEHKTDDILLTDYLYDGTTWKGVSEVWITEDGVVTLRRDLLDLITKTTAEYNGGENAKDYTAASWTAFVSAYDDAYKKSGAAATTQDQIDAAKDALQKAYSELELQAYYTVSVTQTGATGTVKVGDATTINSDTGSAQVVQNKTVSVTVTAPAGYYIASITGGIEASNQVSPYTADLVVDGDKEINVTYKANPTVTSNATEGTVKINGSDSPVSVTYGDDASLSVTAPEGKYIISVMAGGKSLYTGSTESKINFTGTIENITADTAVVVVYGDRTSYNIVIDAYDNANGTLSINGETVPAEGGTYVYYMGDNVEVSATPASGYAVEELLIDGEAVDGTYIFSNLSNNHTVSVTWVKLKEATVTIKGNPNSVGNLTATSGNKTATNTGTNNFTILESEVVTLKVNKINDTRYEFVNWNISGDYKVVSGNRNSEEFVIEALSDLTVTANFNQVYRRIYLDNVANWSTPHIYVWNTSTPTTSYPGDKMSKYDQVTGYWYFDIPMDAKNVKFNNGGNDPATGDLTLDPNKNVYNNSTMTWNTDPYVEAGYYLQGTWNGKDYSAYDQVKFTEDVGGNYVVTVTVTSTVDGYIYVNPTNEKSHFWNAVTADATGNPQTLKALGAYTATPNRVKVEIDTNDYNAKYDVTFTFNPTTGYFSWTKEVFVPTITVNGTDGTLKNQADVGMSSSNNRIGDTYFDEETVNNVTEHTDYASAEVVAGTPVTFYTQVNKTGDGYDYYVAGWVINGTEFVTATNLGDGKYSGSYVFTEDNTSVVPIYFHTDEWLAANTVETVTVYAVADKDITNWNQYMGAYTWYKVGGVTEYEQFGLYPGQLMIPVTGLDNVYYTYVEYSKGDKIQISGITFNNYASATDRQNVYPVTEYSNIQTYDYYEFIALLEDGKENITFVIKDTNKTYNKDQVATNNNETLDQFTFVEYTDYSGLKTDIFGTNIEENYDSLLDSNALYVIQAGNIDMTGSNHEVLDGQWYVKSYFYDSTGKYLGECYSYELHDEGAAIWDTLKDYKGQRAYFSYETVNGARYDGEWYGDADVSVTVNLSVNVALMENGSYTAKIDDPVNEADYGAGYINVQYQSVDATRGDMVTITATPKTGYKFVGWYSADGTLFTANTTYTIMAAVGTTYTAVFEKLETGYFYVNHYLYQGVGTAGYVPPAHGGNAVLYVGIENVSEGTKTTLLQGNSAYIAATEGDKLRITIATDATGADKFYAWYTDAVNKNGLTTFEEVGVDSADNLYDNKGTVVGRNDTVYFQFEYEVSDTFSMNLYSDLMPVSVNVTLVYQYNDRNENIKSYYVPYKLTAQEIEGFAGNNFKKYTPAYISGDGWTNTILANAPYVEDYYKDTTWTINDAMYDTLTFLLWATQPYTMYNVTVYGNGDAPIVEKQPYNYTLRLDAAEMFGSRSGEGFWYEDINEDGMYTEGEDKIITYNAYYSYRVIADIVLGYEKIEDGELDFSVSLDAPVLGREQTTDTNGNKLTDNVIVDYIINIITPNFYGDENYKDAPTYKGEKLEGNWNGAHVTLEDYEAVEGVDVEYGVIIEQFGTSVAVTDDETFAQALAEATANGYGTSSADNDNLMKAADGEMVVIRDPFLVAYRSYTTTNQITNFNRVLLTLSYTNNSKNHGYFYNVYAYVKVTPADGGEAQYYFSPAMSHNIYATGTATGANSNVTV